MKSLDPIKLLRVCVGESAAWASLPQTSTVPGECGAASCSRGNELDDTGRRGSQEIQNVTAYIIIWLLLNWVWGGHKAEPHRLLTSISTWVMYSSWLAQFPFSKCWNREFWLWDPANSSCTCKCRAWISHCASLRPLFRFCWPSLSAGGSQHCSLSTRKVPRAAELGSLPGRNTWQHPRASWCVQQTPGPELGGSRWTQSLGFLGGWGSWALFFTLRC